MKNLFHMYTSFRPGRALALAGALLALPWASQAQMLVISGTGGSSSVNDVTAYVDKVELVRVNTGTTVAGALTNPGFETPIQGNGNYTYRPTGATWTFSGNAAITAANSAFGTPGIAEGNQEAVLQVSPSSISQPLTLAAGTYQVRFMTTQRLQYSVIYDQGLVVTVGGVQVGTVTPPAVASYITYTTNQFTVDGSGNVTTSPNNALAFDGVNDQVTGTNAQLPQGNAARTLEAWVNPSNTGVGLVTYGTNTSNQRSGLSLVSNKLYYAGNGNDLMGNTAIALGTWHHVAATYDGTTLKLYLDGVLDASQAMSSAFNTTGTGFLLGYTGNAAEYLNGRLDEVRIYNAALSQAQVQADMFSTTSALPANLKAYYIFDQGTANGTNTGQTLLADQSGNGNTGTLANFALTGTASNWVRSLPTITGISPSTGTIGTSVSVTGTNLMDATGFKFNGTAVSPFVTPTSDFTATVSVPANASTGLVSTAATNLTRYNGPAFTLTPTNNALALDGVAANSNFVALPGGLNTASFTFESWVNYQDNGPWTRIFDFGTSNNTYMTLVPRSNYPTYTGNIVFVIVANRAAGPEQNIFSTTPMPTGWHHIAVTLATSGATTNGILYLDGVAIGTNAGLTVNPASLGALTNNWLGRSQYSTDPYLKASLDEVRIYSTALTQANIQADMFSTTASVPASLTAYYNFDHGTAGGNNAGITSLADQSGNGNTGTLANFTLTGTTSNWVRSFPTITAITPTSGPIGTSVSVTGTNLMDATGVKFNTTAVAPFATPAGDLSATVSVPGGASTGPVSVSSASLTRYNGAVFTVLSDLTVSTTTTIPAGAYNSITVTGTGTGTLVGNVTVNTSVTVQSGGTLNDGCFVLSGAGSFTLAAGGTLIICSAQGITPSGATGTVQLAGTRSFSPDASYVYNGTTAQVTGTGLPAQVRNLTTANANAVTLSVATAVARILTVASSGNLMLNGQALTILATPTSAALVVNSGTGNVSGTSAVVQAYLDPTTNPGLGYRHLSAPVFGATVASLATASFTPEVSQGSAYNASATPATVTPFPTVFGYDQSRLASVTNNLSGFDKGFAALTASTSSLSPGIGYVVNLAGGQLVSFTGQLLSGPNSFTLARGAATSANAADAGWQLMGNPYPAPLDYSLVTSSDRIGFDAAMYVFASTSQYAGSYRSYVNGVGGNPVLPLGQAFWLRVSAGQTSGVFFVRNSQRLTAQNATTLQRGAADVRPLVQLELRGASGPGDALYAYAQAGASPAFDGAFDAVKRSNTTGLNLSALATTGEALAIDGRPAFTPATVLNLTVGVPAAGTYSLTAAALSNLPAGLDAFLTDNATGRTVNLSQQPVYAFSVSATQAAALISGRFALSFAARSVLANTTALTAAEVTLFPNPAHAAFTVLVPAVAGAGLVQATLFNALGQVVRQQSATLPAAGTRFTVETADLAAGVYTLRLLVGTTTLAKRVVLQ